MKVNRKAVYHDERNGEKHIKEKKDMQYEQTSFLGPRPAKAFDYEYMKEWMREVRFLADKGIRYTFRKKTPDYGVTQYKYKKTPELFSALLEFYTMVAEERKNILSVEEANEAMKGTGYSISKDRWGKVAFVKDDEC